MYLQYIVSWIIAKLSTQSNQLWKILNEIAVPKHFTHYITQNKAQICIEHEYSDDYSIGRGVRQRYILSPLLFNIYGVWVM